MWGIVLEGGGAKGAYQIGVLKYLKEKNIKFGGVVGTSVGACNAAAYVMDNYQKAEDIWLNMPFNSLPDESTEKLKQLEEIKSFSEINLDNIDKVKEDFINNDGLDVDFYFEMFKEFINENKIRSSGLDFGLVTYNLSKKRLEELFIEDIPKGMLYQYVMASSFLPVFKAFRINGDYYLDGGFFNNLPINMLIDKGYKKIIVVRLRPEKYDFSEYKDIRIIDIAPQEYLGNTLQFNKVNIKNNIELGYMDAKNKIKGIEVI